MQIADIIKITINALCFDKKLIFIHFIDLLLSRQKGLVSQWDRILPSRPS